MIRSLEMDLHTKSEHDLVQKPLSFYCDRDLKRILKNHLNHWTKSFAPEEEKLFLLAISTHPVIYLLTFKPRGQSSLKDNHIIVFKYWLWRRGQVMKNKWWSMPVCGLCQPIYLCCSISEGCQTLERGVLLSWTSTCAEQQDSALVYFSFVCVHLQGILLPSTISLKKPPEKEINWTSPLSQNAFLRHPYFTPSLPGLSQWCRQNLGLEDRYTAM